jgi:hypothetical protein
MPVPQALLISAEVPVEPRHAPTPPDRPRLAFARWRVLYVC